MIAAIPQKYRELFGKFFTLACEVVGVNNDGIEVKMPEGTVVKVVEGDYLDEHGDESDDHFRFTVTWGKDEQVSYCGAWFELLTPIPYDQEFVRVCPECGKPIHADMEYRYGGREICESCMNAGADLGTEYHCPKCNKRWDAEHLHDQTGVHTVTGGSCPDCGVKVTPTKN